MRVKPPVCMYNPFSLVQSIFPRSLVTFPHHPHVHIAPPCTPHPLPTHPPLHTQALEPGLTMTPAEARAVEDVIRCRCALVVCCQRLIAEIVADWQHNMPPEHQLKLLGVLKDSVDRAMAFNTNPQRRVAIAVFVDPHAAAGSGGMGGVGGGRHMGVSTPPPPGQGGGRLGGRGVMTGRWWVVQG